MDTMARRSIILDNLTSSVFHYKWNGVTQKEVKEWQIKNGLTLAKDSRDSGIIIGYKQGAREATFRYDTESMTLYSDYTIIDFRQGKAN